jgi:isopenicillin-N epimerase
VKKELQPLFDPLVISWGYQSVNPSHSRFLDYHQTQGTRDFSAFLAVPAAIRFMKENNWKEVAASCHTLVTSNAKRFCDLLSADPLAPLNGDFIGQMLSLPLQTSQPEKLQRTLYDEYQVEIPVMRHGQKVFIRYSINGFNSQNDLDRLFFALEDIREKGKLIDN